jgi:hypothetical protein
MMPGLPSVICLVFGAFAGALTVLVAMRAQLAAETAKISELRVRLEEAAEDARQVAALRAQASSLRHDLRGILSPVMLTADRLVNSQDPAVCKAGDTLIRCVDRATARLAEKSPVQDDSNSVLG